MALGIVAHRVGQDYATVLHGRLGGLDRRALTVIVQETLVLVCNQHGWEIKGTNRRAPGELAQAVVRQIVTEFLSSPCGRCGGHGYCGRRLDTIRHAMDGCAACGGLGQIKVAHAKVLRMCRAGRGKGLIPVSQEVKASKLKPCAACRGMGRVRASATARADAMGCHRSHVYRVWNERFKAVLAELQRIEKVALWTAEDYLA